MIIHHLEFSTLKGGCTGSSQSTLVKMPHCWKSHVTAQMKYVIVNAPETNISLTLSFDMGIWVMYVTISSCKGGHLRHENFTMDVEIIECSWSLTHLIQIYPPT